MSYTVEDAIRSIEKHEMYIQYEGGFVWHSAKLIIELLKDLDKENKELKEIMEDWKDRMEDAFDERRFND